MNIEDLKEFEQIRTPDYSALANCVIRAKGPIRTMSQFAEETQIGASTLSRIINRNVKNPLSNEVIIAIFEHRYDTSDEYLLEALARANGMMPKDYASRVKIDEMFAAKRNEEISRERMMKNSLIASIAACGIGINRVVDMPRTCIQLHPNYPRRFGDFVVELNAETNVSSVNSWVFFLYPQIIDDFDVQRHRSVASEARRIFERLSPWFLLDSWDSDGLKNLKFSFAFADEALFNGMKDLLQIAKLKTEMTLILIDPTDFAVRSEVWIPGDYNQLSNISIFQMPMPESPSSRFDDEDFDDFDY